MFTPLDLSARVQFALTLQGIRAVARKWEMTGETVACFHDHVSGTQWYAPRPELGVLYRCTLREFVYLFGDAMENGRELPIDVATLAVETRS